LLKILKEVPEISVVDTAFNALKAIEIVEKRNDIDVVLLDIEMPGISGLEAISKLLAINNKLKIIMVSTLTSKNAPEALKALNLGASDYVEKPSSINVDKNNDFRSTLIEKVKNLGFASHHIIPVQEKSKTSESVFVRALRSEQIKLRTDKPLNFKPSVLAIASSTGGPRALTSLISSFKSEYLRDIPVFLTQHMPAFMTGILANNLNKLGILECIEASDGEKVKPGHLYVAPGGKHMCIGGNADDIKIILSDGPHVNFCKPSADPMVESICNVYKKKILFIVLTGMGADGGGAAKSVLETNGAVIAQDEETSVVWGMPGNVAIKNLASVVLPLGEIAGYVMKKGI
jgi:two-component system chemotaxis response regulator CheB